MSSDLLRRVLIAGGVLVAAILCLVPTLLRDPALSERWFTRPLALGLDISGGAHLVYRVQTEEAVKGQLQGWLSAVRSELRDKKIAVSEAKLGSDNTLEITLLSTTFQAEAKKILEEKLSEITFIRESVDGTRPKLLYGINDIKAARIKRESVDQAVEVLRNRIDQFGVAEPLIQRLGEDRILLQMPGLKDSAALKKLVGSVAKLEFRLVSVGNTGSTVTRKEKTGETLTLEDPPLLTGAAVSDARVDFDAQGQVEVALKFTKVGGDAFARITSENVGRQLAIVLDDVVYSAPVMKYAIRDGRASITGGFSMEEAGQLKMVLKSGALPAPLSAPLEERNVGPTLGWESIQKAMLGSAVGFAAILIFMSIYYRKSGVVAVVTLLVNAFLMLAALSLFGAALTLPGIAGLALTIGMAVDSNVIIFERIRDEIRLGKSRDLAVDSGFKKAFSAIFDSNVTTMIAGVILYNFGTGPVRGFAVTLCIGIATTIFCAVFLSRILFDYFDLKAEEGLSI